MTADIDDYLDEADKDCLIEELQSQNINIVKHINTHLKSITEDDIIALISRKKNLSVIQADKLKTFLQSL
jgi:hypothetical protein